MVWADDDFYYFYWLNRLAKFRHGVLGAIQVLRNADGGGGCQVFRKIALRRCNIQRY